MSNEPVLHIERDSQDAFAVFTMNRPDKLNALDLDLLDAIDAAMRAAQDDPDIRAIVLTGAGRAFTTGFDLASDDFEMDADGWQADMNANCERLRVIWDSEVPVIAAINGYALGGGLELALGADFRYMADDAKVGQPEIRLGLIPGAGGTQRLPRLIGYQAAKRLNLSGRHVPAAEALDLGIADLVVPSDQLLDRALEDAARWAEGPTRAYAAVKRAMADGYGRPLDEALAIERAAFNGCFRTEDARRGIEAFINKETPEFIGA